MATPNAEPTGEQDGTTDNSGRTIDRRRLLKAGGAGVLATGLLSLKPIAASTDRLEIVAARNADVDYTVRSEAAVEYAGGKGLTAPEPDEDLITEDNGTYTVDGSTADGYGDAFDLSGEVTALEPADGDYELYLNGERVTHDELVQSREHSYAVEATGEEWADYYIEVEDGGEMVASTLAGATVDPEFHWVSADGTKAAGRVHPGDRHAYEFDNLVLDVTIEGEADAYVDGSSSSLEWYPQPGATGDGWKAGFPWQFDREHSYAFEGTGEEWADYYLEVEDGGEMVVSRLDEASVDPGFYWVSADGTKAAGRVHPGDRDAYEFDNLVLDVTIDGEADAYVDGSSSSLEWYPQPGASGDDWKGGFPWQDEEEETTQNSAAMGGGDGYDRILTRDDADTVVSTASGIESALSSASSGDVVFVDGAATIDTGSTTFDVPSGVTLASNRGEGGASGALLHTEETPQVMLRPQANARVTGLRIRGVSPGETVTHRDGISFNTPTYAMCLVGGDVEVDNCEVWGWPDRAVSVEQAGAHVHHNYIYDNNGQGLGYGVAAADECLIEYNYFHNNRHSVTCAYYAPGYTARYNHFSPVSVMHICDVHDPFEGDTTLESNIVENGETRTWDANDAAGMAGYPDGFDGGSLTLTDNWFFDEATAYDDGFAAVSDSGNVYGDESTRDPADVVPDHPGMADRPWT